MSHHPTPQFDDPYLQSYFEKVARRDHRQSICSAGRCMLLSGSSL